MQMPGRSYNSDEYRYGFNGMEKDDEVKGSGNSLDFGARIYDARIGRWLALDPLAAKYPGMSPYNGIGNNPILLIDPDGKELILGGNQAQALADLRSMVPVSDRDLITMNSEGVVSFAFFNADGTPHAHDGTDAGTNLIENLINSEKR